MDYVAYDEARLIKTNRWLRAAEGALGWFALPDTMNILI